MKVTMIMVESLNGKISQGVGDKLKWGGAADKQHFKDLTMRIGTVVMGSGTFESLGCKPLSGRQNIVLTSNPLRYADKNADNLEFSSELPAELIARLDDSLPEIALVGGGRLNAEFLNEGLVDEMYITIAPTIFPGAQEIFSGLKDRSIDLKLIEQLQLDENTICLHYEVKPLA
jgi:dihydrofolate reductase